MRSVLFASALVCGAWCKAADEGAPAIRPLSEEDFAAGIVLTGIGTGEEFDFSAPDGAEVCADWEAFGAARDWFRLGFVAEDDDDEYAPEGWSFAMGTNRVDSFTVFSYGTVRPSVTNVSTCISPLNSSIGIVPVSNHGMLEAEDRPSRFWHCLTPSNTLQLTWQNVLLDREVSKPVSFQAEINRLGDIVFKYDLSRLPEEALANLSAGVMNDGRGRMFSWLPRDITSLRWRYLNPSLPNLPDHDGDGISTSDELFVYGTDPYSTDTDRDGLTDYEEVVVANTNPNARYSSNAKFPDSVASALGGEDPYSCPNGDGRTAFENVVYTGSPYGRGGEPVSDSSTAVLEVSVVGAGRGVIMVGDKIVPLLQGVNPIKVAVPKGKRVKLKCELEGELYPNYNSSNFCIGKLPYGARERGWVLFPYVEASHPCIHVDTSAVTVRLYPAENEDDDDGFTCSWSSDDGKVKVFNTPPRSANLLFDFPRKATSSVRYEIRHPDYLFGEKVFQQVCEHCPKIEDDEEYSSTKDYLDEQMDSAETEDESWCEEHCCYYWNCRYKHELELYSRSVLVDESVTNDYRTAVNSPKQYTDILKLHRPCAESENRNIRLIDVVVPKDKYQCCQCKDHWESCASIGFKSRHLAVHNGVEPFTRTTTNCTLSVFGVSPSEKIGDSRVSILTNGAVYAEFEYTVFGVSILGDGVDLDRLNRLNSSFGMPVVINTNLNRAVNIRLCTDVNLSDGVVRLAFENPKARMQLWMEYTTGDYSGHEQHLLLLDSETRPELELSITEWKRLVRKATFKRETTLQLLAYGTGSADLVFGYAGGKDGKYLHDEAVQTITAIRPPLLPDYNRDGRIDDSDAFDYSNGRKLYFWANQDTWRGDDAFSQYSDGVHFTPMLFPTNGADMVVNGRNDLVNLCPFAVDMSQFVNAWGDEKVKYELTTTSGDNVHVVPVDMFWSSIGNIVSEDQRAMDGVALHSAGFQMFKHSDRTGCDEYELPMELIRLGERNKGVIAFEFAKPEKEVYLRVHLMNREDKTTLFEREIKICVLDVHDMYRWINLDYVCEPRKEDDKTEEDKARERKYVSRDWVSWPDDEHADANVFFVHGFNVHIDEAWDWSQAMFKRLWWAGMNAGFTAVRWYGNEGQLWVPKIKPFTDSNGYGTRNYHQNVFNAFRTAGALSRTANQLPGKRKYYIAHSLGNMLVCAAKQFHGLEYDKYMMLNAAVAMEALDPSAYAKQIMTPKAWRAYPDTVKASHWYDLFDELDERRKLTWRGLFKDVDNVVNFYSSMDEVVANGDGNWKWPLTRDFAWYNQERAKGTILVDYEHETGWVFSSEYRKRKKSHHNNSSSYRRYTPSEAKGIDKEKLKLKPFCGEFSREEILGDGGSEFIRNNEYRWRVLSHGVPAESLAIGANSLPILNTSKCCSEFGENVEDDINIDMSIKCISSGLKQVEWIHSYFIEMSLFDTKELFLKLVNNIGGAKNDIVHD